MGQSRPGRGARTVKINQKLSLRRLLQLLVVGLLIYIVLAGLSGFERSLHAILAARLSFVCLAICAVLLSYAAAACTYLLISPKRLVFLPTFVIQIASGLVNRLLPAGLGGLGINALYLKKQQLSLAVASAVVATNNLLGFIGNGILIGLVLAYTPLTLTKTYHLSVHFIPAWIGVVLFFVILGAVLYLRHAGLQGRIAQLVREMARYFVLLGRRPVRSITALLSSCALTSLQTTALCFVMMAVGLHADWPVALMAISAGALLTSLVPTPGGLGGAEAGISTALFAFGIPSELAIAAALIYRGLTYWLPLLPGYVAFRFAEKRFL